MLRKIDFSLYIFDIPDISSNYGLELFTLDNFSNYLYQIYVNHNYIYDFQLGVTYNIHLVDVYDQVFSVVPFKLESIMVNAELLACYNKVNSELGKFVAKSEYGGFLIIYIGKDIVGEINYKELTKCIADSLEELNKLEKDLSMFK